MPGDNIKVVKLTARQVRILNGRHFATVATVNADCSPEATVIWFETDRTFIYFNTALHRIKARNLLRDNRVAITVLDPPHPYEDTLAIGRRAAFITACAHQHTAKLP